MEQRALPAELVSPFLDAKVQPPLNAGPAVRRQRLIDVLDDGDARRLTIVSGPPGAGKTSLLAAYARHHKGSGPVAWLTLDRHDNDPVEFWTAVVAALASIAAPDATTSWEALARATRADTRTFLTALATELAAWASPPTLVLDDYHNITNGDVHEGIRTTVRYLAVQLRVVIGTRLSPPLHLGRLRAQGQLCEIRFDDLRFTADEGSELVESLAGTAIDATARRELVASTEGWAAAIYVRAIGSLRHGDTRRDADAQLADYLVDEVLAGQPESRRDFLLRTSVLDTMTPARCDAITDTEGSAAVLRELERSSQFVRRSGTDGEVFTYHAMLRDLLRAEAAARGLPIGQLHARASEIAEADGDHTAAIHHAFEADDVDRGAALIGRWWIETTNRGRFATVAAWVERWSDKRRFLPRPLRDATVMVVGAWTALNAGRLDDVETWLTQAERVDHVGPLPDGTASSTSAAAIVRTSHRRRIGAVTDSVAASEIAVEAESDPASPWRAVALVGRGATLFWAGAADARAVLDEAVTLARTSGLVVPIVLGDGHLSLLDQQQGDRARAYDRARRAVELAHRQRLEHYDQAAVAHLALGRLQLDDIDLDDAKHNITAALRLGEQGGERLVIGAAHLAASRLAHLRDRPGEVAAALAAAQRVCDLCSDPGVLARMLAETRRALDGRPDTVGRSAALTNRELVVLRFLASALSVPAIARELHVSANTVKSQAASIRSKLGVSNRADAVRVARERGLLT